MKIVQLSDLTPDQRRLVLALVACSEAKQKKVEAFVKRTTEASGVPEKLEDPVVTIMAPRSAR